MIKKLESIEEFNSLINKERVLIDFFATWCGPCKMLAPVIEDAHKLNELGDITILEIDIDQFEELARKYSIMAVPTLMYFKLGNKIDTSLGYITKEKLIEFVSK